MQFSLLKRINILIFCLHGILFFVNIAGGIISAKFLLFQGQFSVLYFFGSLLSGITILSMYLVLSSSLTDVKTLLRLRTVWCLSVCFQIAWLVLFLLRANVENFTVEIHSASTHIFVVCLFFTFVALGASLYSIWSTSHWKQNEGIIEEDKNSDTN